MRASQSIAGTCAVRSVSTDALGRVASRYRHRYQGIDAYPDLLLPWLLPEMDRRGEGKSTLATSSSDPHHDPPEPPYSITFCYFAAVIEIDPIFAARHGPIISAER